MECFAKDERTTVSVTERLAQAKSHLNLDELIEALDDPRFNVRFEAILSRPSVARQALPTTASNPGGGEASWNQDRMRREEVYVPTFVCSRRTQPLRA